MSAEKKNLDKPDDVRNFPNGRMAVVELPGVSVGRGVLNPGWKWSNDVKPIVETETCQQAHTMYVLQGTLHIAMDDGTETEITTGDAAVVPPGHDAWVAGEEDFIALDWTGAATYAQPT